VIDFSQVNDPLALLDAWRTEAEGQGAVTPDAMTLCTVDGQGRPRARIVFLRGRAGRELRFFTNYESQKGQDLLAHPYATCLFYFPELERQVCVSGPVLRLDRQSSEAYFRARPRDNQLGAWASRQSRPIESREVLLAAFDEVSERFRGQDVPCPPNWGGFSLNAERVEVWIGILGRLHHRAEFELEGEAEGAWRCQLLSP
jgi:pyridoxamine 5'-phosphate oxidase